jgi:adenylate cyclase
MAAKYCAIFLGIFLGICSHVSTAQTTGEPKKGEPAAAILVASLTDSAQRIFAFDEESEVAYFLGKKACLEATKSQNLELINKAYHSLITNSPQLKHHDELLEYANLAVQRNNKIEGNFGHWRALQDLAGMYRVKYNSTKALEVAQLSLAVAESIESDSLKCLSYLTIGSVLDLKNKKLDGLRYLHNAKKIAETLKSEQLKFQAYTALANFYNFSGGATRAIRYNKQRYKIWQDLFPSDSNTLYDVLLFGENVNFWSNDNSLNEEFVEEILAYAKRQKNQNIKRSAMALYRSHLIEALNYKRLHRLYIKQFPEELEELRIKSPALHSKVLACLHEYRNDIDSSLYYYRLSEMLLDSEDNPILKSNTFMRYGQFLERQNRDKQAIVKFEQAYNLAASVSYYHYMLLASKHLHNLYFKQNDYAKAYEFSVSNRNLEDSLNQMARKDELIVMEFSKEMERDSVLRAKERQTTETRHQREVESRKKQTRTIALVGLFVFLLAIGLFNRLRYMRRTKAEIQFEKDRSDGLLLNILPQDIAEELKQSGKAEAKKFENVSILFTDFKNFTKAAEELPAIELVEEINEYFKMFDQITDSFKIEKIKTIGDAYMAAGGIPRSYQDSVKRTVLAAIEMQEKLKTINQSRKKEHRHIFQMRVGVHTGPVVAGIVGAKKFQYDVWGDSVNIAARMEQAGSVGQVNISGATYEIIKDEPEFVFESRGKIIAKNKGEIEMYFVTKSV